MRVRQGPEAPGGWAQDAWKQEPDGEAHGRDDSHAASAGVEDAQQGT